MPQISPTQDLETRFSVFLNPIRDLTKNWEVDIAKYLEEYLEELAEVQITFDGGETLMNFAEAAMLIQGSATVYSKKVEFLWQMVLQMLDLLSSRRNVDSVEAGDGKEGNGGGKAPLDFSLDFNSVDNIGEGRNIDLREEDQDEAEDSRRRGFKFLPATPLHLVEKEGEKSQHRVSLLMKNEIFGAKDDFRINRSYLTPMGMLCMEVPTEILRDGALALMDFSVAGGERMDNAEKRNFESAPEALVDPSAPQEENLHAVIIGGYHESDAEVGDGVADFPDNMDPPMDDQMAMNIQEGCKEKTDKDRNEARNNNNMNVIDFPDGRYGLGKRGGAEKQAVTKLKLTDPWKPLDPHAESPAKRPVRAGRLRKPQPCPCHLSTQSVHRRKYAKNKENANEDKKVRKSLPSIESYITGELASMIGSSTKNHKVPSEILDELNKEVAKRLEHGKRKRVKDLMNEGGTLNVEEAMQMVIEDTEIQQRVEEQLDDRIDGDGAVDLDSDANDVPAPPLFLPEPHDDTREPECVNKRCSDNQFDEPASDYEALVQKWVAEYVTNAQVHVNSTSLVKRVNRWRETITPKLKEEESRKEFDIHSYGSEVLSYFPDNGRKQTIPFSDLAKNRDPREVSRLFLSCLMLANTYNIELSESEPGDLAMDCLELTLLTRMRHHEELEGYAAPSQASPPKRKSCAKAKHQPKSLLDETRISSGEPSPICADITQITLAENVQFNSKKSTKCRVKTKR